MHPSLTTWVYLLQSCLSASHLLPKLAPIIHPVLEPTIFTSQYMVGNFLCQEIVIILITE